MNTQFFRITFNLYIPGSAIPERKDFQIKALVPFDVSNDQLKDIAEKYYGVEGEPAERLIETTLGGQKRTLKLTLPTKKVSINDFCAEDSSEDDYKNAEPGQQLSVGQWMND